MTFSSLLIANRAEIGVRIARTARALGLRTVAVYSDADRNAPHVRVCDDAVAIGGDRPADSYLRIDKLIDAARAGGAQAVHPGYGFLAESAAFAQAVQDAGLVFVGPPPAAIAAMGDKSAARRQAAALGLPVLAGYDGDAQDEPTLRAEAQRIGFPLMVKAAAGGGGRGMRLVREADELDAALRSARSEAQAAFGDGKLLLESALLAPRHVEIQVLADAYGNAVYLGERDCSVQRRHQKIVEEAPCPVLTPTLRRAMGEAALKLVHGIGYVGAGTVEFLLEGNTFTFMEMNTRLQVEHPVTELVLGLDLVEWQLRIAQGELLTLWQDDVLARFERGGHAIEVRLCAEDPAADFLPHSGRIEHWEAPRDIRVDHAVESGIEISPFYDSMVGKLIAHAPTRTAAALKLAAALDRTVVFGVPTNRAFLARVLRHPAFVGNDVSTAFIAQHFGDAASGRQEPSEAQAALAALISARYNPMPLPPELSGWRSSGVCVTPVRLAAGETRFSGRVEGVGVSRANVSWGEQSHTVEIESALSEGSWSIAAVAGRRIPFLFVRERDRIWLQAGGIDVAFDDRRLQPAGRRAAAANGAIVAPMHGRVISIAVQSGARVSKGMALATMEAMKMEHALVAAADGTVRAVHVREGEQVAAGKLLLELETES
jgi:geranyl-CoA carboxylase alpha subunit